MQWICYKLCYRHILARLCLLLLLFVFAVVISSYKSTCFIGSNLNSANVQVAIRQRRDKIFTMLAKWRQQHRSLRNLRSILNCAPKSVRMQQLQISKQRFALTWQDLSANNDLDVSCWRKLQANVNSVERSVDGVVNVSGVWDATSKVKA